MSGCSRRRESTEEIAVWRSATAVEWQSTTRYQALRQGAVERSRGASERSSVQNPMGKLAEAIVSQRIGRERGGSSGGVQRGTGGDGRALYRARSLEATLDRTTHFTRAPGGLNRDPANGCNSPKTQRRKPSHVPGPRKRAAAASSLDRGRRLSVGRESHRSYPTAEVTVGVREPPLPAPPTQVGAGCRNTYYRSVLSLRTPCPHLWGRGLGVGAREPHPCEHHPCEPHGAPLSACAEGASRRRGLRLLAARRCQSARNATVSHACFPAF